VKAGVTPIRVVTLADDRYAMPLAVMGRSLLENHRPGRPLRLTVIDGGVTPENRARVERSWSGAAAGSAEWKWVAPSFGRARRLPVWGRVPALTYARIFLDAYCEDGENQVLVLDSDTLVLADVADLQDTDLEGRIIGACVDPFIPTVSSIDGLPPSIGSSFPKQTPYFNAGMMVVDLRRWRDARVSERSLEYIEMAQGHLRQYDQDALNVTLAGAWKQLDAEWNVQPRAANALGQALPMRPRIVHFSGRLKPWEYGGSTELDRIYFDYLGRTDWKAFRVPATWRGRAWKIYDSPLRRLLYPVECRALALRKTLQWRAESPPQAGSLRHCGDFSFDPHDPDAGGFDAAGQADPVAISIDGDTLAGDEIGCRGAAKAQAE
jgi:lipopolysaccharide biosynthesis glycosyltransferase